MTESDERKQDEDRRERARIKDAIFEAIPVDAEVTYIFAQRVSAWASHIDKE